MGHEHDTERYFDDNTPTYSLGRYRDVVEFLTGDTPGGASLLDLGCGSGNVLRLLATRARLGTIAGVDASGAALERCAAEVPGCTTYLGSVLDHDLRGRIGREFRYVLLGAVLHHLVGRTRRTSLALAGEGLANAWAFVEPGGSLILVEPTFRPRWLMTSLFHTKRLVTRVTAKRVPIFGYWNNLGAPVVSYYSHGDLVAHAGELPGGEIVVDRMSAMRLPVLWRLFGVTERADSVIVIRRVG
jgi:SAM-dependent methyltransferase